MDRYLEPTRLELNHMESPSMERTSGWPTHKEVMLRSCEPLMGPCSTQLPWDYLRTMCFSTARVSGSRIRKAIRFRDSAFIKTNSAALSYYRGPQIFLITLCFSRTAEMGRSTQPRTCLAQ